MSEFDLSLNNVSRQLNIFDCCRKKIIHPYFPYLKESKIIESSLSVTNVELYRKRFNELLENSIEGKISIYSCSVDEEAIDMSNFGGLFSCHLLYYATGNENLSVYKAFKKVEPIVQELSSHRQNPVIHKPRMKGYTFPFYLGP